jgi:hypothetical protein
MAKKERSMSRYDKYPPDPVFWSREDEWELHDAALLLCHLEPRSGLGLHFRKLLQGSPDGEGAFIRADQILDDQERALLARARDIVRRAVVAGRKRKLALAHDRREGKAAVEPREFLIWAEDKGDPIPAGFRPLATDPRDARRWPWGDHTTPLLEALAQAARAFWSTYDPSEPTTASTNQEVARWLVDEHNVAQRTADVMAKLLRPEGLPAGRPRKVRNRSRDSTSK